MSQELTPEQKYQQAKTLLNIAQATFNEENQKEAAQLLQQSAEAGYAPAYIALGQCYANGTGVDFDDAEEDECYKKAADLGSEEGALMYARKYYYSYYDHATAYEYVQKALANDEHGNAHYMLGLLYYHGEGPAQDFEKSYAAHVHAAGKGNTDAMFELYVFYSKGIGCEINNETAMAWNKKAADLGHYRAAYNMGWFYETGTNVEQDINKAFEYYTVASNGGNGKATAYIGVMYQKGMIQPAETLDTNGNWDEDKAREIANTFYDKAENEQEFYDIYDFLESLDIERD